MKEREKINEGKVKRERKGSIADKREKVKEEGKGEKKESERK